MSALPEPLTPAGCDVRSLPYMPFDVIRLRRSKSWLGAKRDPALGFYLMNLWTAAWHEVPAGSVEDDDDALADLAMCDPRKWSRVRDAVLRGWVKCSDGRLYHPVVSEKVINALEGREGQRQRTEAARQSLLEKRQRLSPDPTESVTKSVADLSQTPKGREGKKSKGKKEPPYSPPPGGEGLPVWLPQVLWADFVASRRSLNKPMSDLAAGQMLRRLEGFHTRGLDLAMLLGTAIRRGWLDVYEPKADELPLNGERPRHPPLSGAF